MNKSHVETTRNKEIASNCMVKFEEYLSAGNIGRACAHLLIALKLEPSLKSKSMELLAETLRQWGKRLAARDDYTSLINGYEQALQIYPDNEFVLNDFGAFLFRCGRLTRAYENFKKACSIRADYVQSERSLQICLSAMVDRWHFRMLNDSNRNEAYREAIMKKIKQGFNHVLDIGAGTGLLSLIAADGCTQFSPYEVVFACEECPYMYEIARSILETNKMESRIFLIYGNSVALDVSHLEDRRVSLVVTEVMDAGIFGEKVLETLIEAWEKLLLPPLPLHSLLPPSPCMICIDKELEPHQRETPRINGIVVPFGATVWLAAIECFHIARKYRSLHKLHYDLKTPFIFKATTNDPYDTENLQSFTSGFKLLCEPTKCFYVNFNNPQNLLDFFNGKFDEDLHSIEFTKQGNLHAFVIWFDLHVDEDLKITTSPFSETATTCCWDQAIFPYQNELETVPGSCAKLKVRTKDGKLLVQVSEIDQPISKPLVCEEVPVSQEFVRFFNNTDMISNLFAYSHEVMNINSILDFSPFPFLGLYLTALGNSKLCFVAKSKNDILAVEKIAEKNQIPPERIMYILEDELDGSKLILNSPFDLIISNLIAPNGEFCDTGISLLSLSRNFINDKGVILPEKISLWGQLISSEWLKRSAEVLEEGIVNDYRIPEYINKFKVRDQLDLSTATLSHSALSEPHQIGIFTMDDIDSDDIHFQERIKVTSPGKFPALLYWFQCEVKPSNHDSLKFSTQNIQSHVNQVCVLMESSQLELNKSVLVSCKYQAGGFIFKFQYD